MIDVKRRSRLTPFLAVTALAAGLGLQSTPAGAFGRARPSQPERYSNATAHDRIRHAVEIAHESLVFQNAVRPGEVLPIFVFGDLLTTEPSSVLAADAELSDHDPSRPIAPGFCSDVANGFKNSKDIFPQIKSVIAEIARLSSKSDASQKDIDRLSVDLETLNDLRRRLLDDHPPQWDEKNLALEYSWTFEPRELLAVPTDAKIVSIAFAVTSVLTPQDTWSNGNGKLDLDHFRFGPGAATDAETPVAVLAAPDFDAITLAQPVSAIDSCLGDVRVEVHGDFQTTYQTASGQTKQDKKAAVLYGDDRHRTLSRQDGR